MGAGWIFGMCLTFTLMFTAYMAISVNYGKTNKFKSEIVSMVEEHEGYNDDLENKIIKAMDDEGYGVAGNCDDNYSTHGTDWALTACINSGATGGNLCNICIYREMGNGVEDIGAPRSRYRVVTFMKFDIPVVRYLFSIKVAGETKYFYDFAS